MTPTTYSYRPSPSGATSKALLEDTGIDAAVQAMQTIEVRTADVLEPKGKDALDAFMLARGYEFVSTNP